MEDRHLSLSEVAELMEVTERTVRRWIKSGRLKAYKPGRDYRIPESAVKKFIERSEAYPKAPAPLQLELEEQRGADEERRLIHALARVVEVAMERWQAYLDSLPEQPTPEERREVVKRLKETIVDATKLHKVLEENFDLVAPYADAINAGKPVPQPLRGDVIVLEHALFGIGSYLIPKAKEWASIDKEWSEWATNERIRLEDTAQ